MTDAEKPSDSVLDAELRQALERRGDRHGDTEAAHPCLRCRQPMRLVENIAGGGIPEQSTFKCEGCGATSKWTFWS